MQWEELRSINFLLCYYRLSLPALRELARWLHSNEMLCSQYFKNIFKNTLNKFEKVFLENTFLFTQFCSVERLHKNAIKSAVQPILQKYVWKYFNKILKVQPILHCLNVKNVTKIQMRGLFSSVGKSKFGPLTDPFLSDCEELYKLDLHTFRQLRTCLLLANTDFLFQKTI